MYTIVLLAEHALTPHDVARVAQLHDPDPVRVHVLVPAVARHNPLIEALEDVALGRRSAHETAGEGDVDHEAAARRALEASVAALREVGVDAEGSLVPDDPVQATVEVARRLDAGEILVITPPHPVEDALRRDWASRLRDRAARPVLHAVSGTDRVVS